MRFRAQLEHLWILKGRDNCVYVLPTEEFQRISQRLKEMGAEARDLQRVIWGSAVEQGTDKQGRVSIPETLRRFAGLQKEVTVVGSGDRVEIWDRQRWNESGPQRDQAYADFTGANTDLPI